MTESLATVSDDVTIAVIAMDGAFPGAPDVESYWRNLCAGTSAIASLDAPSLQALGVPETLRADPAYIPVAANLTGIELLDAEFFGIGAREAQAMDPQHRRLLEAARNALERGGYDPARLDIEVGAFFGVAISQYLLHNLMPQPAAVESLGDDHVVFGNYASYACTRIAHRLNLRGPVLALDTACSSSLVAVHLACKALLNFECDAALAGGAQVNLPQQSGYLYHSGAFRSPDGVCRSFDAQALGTVFGSGVGVVLLKRMEDARRDGDSILALIRGSAINNDGAEKLGFSAPGVTGQTAVIERALGFAGVSADSISYVETHGTGTPLGDPIEIAALTAAFRADTGRRNFCAIGSVKPSVGHLETAAGIAGLIKAVLALHHRQLPASLNFERPNPEIDFAASPFCVNTQLSEWRSDRGPRRAGVSSFGVGGSNAHLILEEYVAAPAQRPSRPQQLLLWSAKTERALEAATGRLAAHLTAHPEQDLADVAYTLQCGREAFGRRRMLVCADRESALAGLQTESAAWVSAQVDGKPASVALLFPGQGAQHVDMAAAIYRHEPVFRGVLDDCAQRLQAHLGLDLRNVLYPAADQAPAAADLLNQTWITQPALFAVSYALARQWEAWGVRADAMLGHSIGEYVAACLAGVYTLADALRLVALRGRLMQSLPAGEMLAVPLAESELAALGVDGWDLAAVNAPRACVLAGTTATIDALVAALQARGVEGRRLRTSHAFHSAMMDPILATYAQAVAATPRQAPTRRFVSNVTGDWILAEQALSADYWVRHLRGTVRFAAGVERLLAEPSMLLLEAGPGQTLTTLARQQPAARGRNVLASLPHAREERDAQAALLGALGRLWLAQVEIDWTGFYADEQRRRVLLPTYPFERKRYWIDPPAGAATTPLAPRNDVLPFDQWFHAPVWTQRMVASAAPAAAAHWVVFCDQPGHAQILVEALRERGDVVISVSCGTEYAHHADGVQIRSSVSDDYDRLAQLLEARSSTHRIVHAWCLDWAGEDYARSQQLGFFSVLLLAQACARRHGLRELWLQLLSRGLADVYANEPMDALKASVLGLMRVVGLDCPQIRCGSIDLTPDADLPSLVRLLDEPPEQSQLALRGTRCWRLGYAPWQPSETTDLPLRPAGVYLISGGLGDLGLLFAEYLARTCGARLVLTTRRALPERALWPQIIASGDDPILGQRLQRVQALQAQGIEVLICCCDVANADDVAALVDAVRARFGEVHGLLHAAGVAGGGLLQLRRVVDAERVLAPKVRGAQLLLNALADTLDFAVLHSSLFAVSGGAGQGDYAGANAALDLLAHQHARGGLRIVSINWDGWRETGMAARAGAFVGERAQGIDSASGLAVLGRVLSGFPGSQVVISTEALQPARPSSPTVGATARLEQHERPPLASAYVPAGAAREQQLVGIWRDVLGLRQVGIHDNFFDLGGSSLLMSEVLRRIHRELDAALTITEMFQFPTIHALTARLSGAEVGADQSSSATEAGNRRREALQHKRRRITA